MHGPFQHPGINRHLLQIGRIPKAQGFSQVYQCKCCGTYYGQDSRIPNLTPAPPVTGHYLDSSTWSCPKCGTHQDSRDTQPFLGCRGTGQLRLLTEEDILQELLFLQLW